MKIFIINLEHAHERRDSVERQMAALGLEYEFIPAVYGKHLSPEERAQKYDDSKAFRNQCRSLVDAEIGIALSHINIYERIINEDISSACILEDDVILPENFAEMLSLLEETVSADLPEIILLSHAETKGAGRKIGNVGIKDFKTGFYASSYIVNNLGARALREELFPVGDVADCWDRLRRHKVIDIKVVTPPLVTQNRAEFGSSTTDEINLNYKYNLNGRIKFKLSRAFWLSIDGILAVYHRNFRPYRNLIKK